MNRFLNAIVAVCLLVLVSCASSVNPAVGSWNISLDTPMGQFPAVMTIAADGTGSFNSDLAPSMPISGITFNGNAVNFSTDVEAQGMQLTLVFNAEINGDTLSGELGTDFGDMAVTGTRLE